MTKPVTDPQRHLHTCEQTHHLAEEAWREAHRRLCASILRQGDPAILEDIRLQAVASYEAMFDATIATRRALVILDAADAAKRKPKKT